MISPTHFAFGILATSLACQSLNPAILLVGGCSSLLPDIDHTESIIGRLLLPISKAINERFGHRTITHSLIGVLIVAAISAAIFTANQQVAVAFFVGYLSAIVGDMMTKSGVKLFWPDQSNWAILENPALRFKTGGIGEFVLLLVIFSGAIANFNAVSGGGISEVASNYYSGLIGKKKAAVDFFNRHSNQYLIGLKITGYMASDRRPVSSNFRVIHIEGASIYVQNPLTGYLYKLEQEIIVTKVKPYKEGIGSASTNKLTLNDEKLEPRLKSGEIYYFGKLSLEDAGSVPLLKPSLEYLIPYKIEGESVVISGAKREQMPFLNQYATGELTEVKLDY